MKNLLISLILTIAASSQANQQVCPAIQFLNQNVEPWVIADFTNFLGVQNSNGCARQQNEPCIWVFVKQPFKAGTDERRYYVHCGGKITELTPKK